MTTAKYMCMGIGMGMGTGRGVWAVGRR